MQDFKDKIQERISDLQKLIKEKEAKLRHVPKGTIHVDRSGGRTQFQHYYNGKRRYLGKRDDDLLKRLMQKDYDEKVRDKAKQEMAVLENLLKKYLKLQYECVYDQLHSERKNYITPVAVPDDEFILQWETYEYEKKGFREDFPEHYTNKGERVRSKTEVLIANALAKYNVPYRYEEPLYLKQYGKIHPDFKVLNVRLRKEFFWEHLGKMDDAEYCEEALDRITAYEKNGFFPGDSLILTHETLSRPINSKIIDAMIEKYLL